MEICRYFVGTIKLDRVPQINHSGRDSSSRVYFTFAFHAALSSFSQAFEQRIRKLLKRRLSHP